MLLSCEAERLVLLELIIAGKKNVVTVKYADNHKQTIFLVPLGKSVTLLMTKPH